MELAISHVRDIAADPALLSELEREALTTIRGDRRRDEWIRGRLAIRRALGDRDASVVIAPDGAPLVIGASRSVSLSHTGDWIAVAVAAAPVGVDLCLRADAARVARILAWLGVGVALEPIAAWAALEATLKLQRLPIARLLDRGLEVHARDRHALVVHGLGDPVSVSVRRAPDYIVAVTDRDSIVPTTV